MASGNAAATDPVHAVRQFTRFYTRRLDVLREGLLDSPFTLTEARVLYELAHRDSPMAGDLGRDLGLDAGYLSRILKRFEALGLIERSRSSADGRQLRLALTPQGRSTFAPLDERSRTQVEAMLASLSAAEQGRLVDAMHAVEALLGDQTKPNPPYALRFHRPGDMGWIVHRHAALYAQEYGWDQSFEALVAEIAATFIKEFDPSRERCWIAEADGEILGSVMLVKQSHTVAKLRLLYVEPRARGLGVGKRLVAECIAFARAVGYERITLWTNDVLHAARKLYKDAGFVLVKSEPHHSFGHDLVGESWELDL